MNSLFKYLLTFFIISQPYLVHAIDIVGDTGEGDGSASLKNPLRSNDLMEFLQELLDVIMVFAVPLIVFMIIYAGFLYVMARGNEAEVTKASRALLYAVIGGVIILGANIILAVISGTVDAFR